MGGLAIVCVCVAGGGRGWGVLGGQKPALNLDHCKVS